MRFDAADRKVRVRELAEGTGKHVLGLDREPFVGGDSQAKQIEHEGRNVNNAEKLPELKRVQARADTLRKELGIGLPGEILYQAYSHSVGDDLVVVVADGFGGATTSIVEGNYPVDYCTKFERQFETEREAESAAESVTAGNRPPADVLDALI